MLRVMIVMFVVVMVSACGGGGGEPPPNSGQVPPPVPQPQFLTLNYPADFPYTIQMDGMLQGIIVNGLTEESAYNFSYQTDSQDIKLLIVNNQAQSITVCNTFVQNGSEYNCIGTVHSESVLYNVSNFSSTSQTVILDITPSSSTPLLNHGTQQNPVELNAGNALPHSTTVAANGESFYRINNLITGSRYQLKISNQSDSVAMQTYRDLFVTDAQCDPNYSAGDICNFVSEGTSVALHVDGTFAFTGASFDIALSRLSQAGEFEGTWYRPQVHDVVNNDLPRVAIVDDYNSYYKLTGLQTGLFYNLEYTSKTDAASLQFFDPVTGRAIGKSCNPDTRTNLTAAADEACTFRADSSDLYMIAKGNAVSPDNSKFIVKITPGPVAQGISSTPVSLTLINDRLQHQASVDINGSYYHVNGMMSGVEYMVRLSGNEALPVNLSVYDGDSSYATPVTCTVENQFGNKTYCILTANSADLYIKVDGPTTPPGIEYTLNVTPAPVIEANQQLQVSDLPYAGQVNDFFSKYTVSGLVPNSLYIARLAEANGIFVLDAWDDASSVLSCSVRTRVSGGCLLDSGPNGNINMRVGTGELGSDNNEPGGFFKLDLLPAPVLKSNYQSTDTPLLVPDNAIAGVSSQITVNSPVSAITDITVEVIVEHGYTPDVTMQLTAPDGTTIPLVANILGTEYINTEFNDYATQLINNAVGLRYNNTFRPISPMHVLNGLAASGTWTLNVADSAYTNRTDALGGTLHAWGLSFK